MSNNHQGPIKEINHIKFQVLDLAFFPKTSPLKHHPHLNLKHISIPVQLIKTPGAPPLKVGKFLLGADRLILPPGVTHPKAPGKLSDKKNRPLNFQPTGILKEASAIRGTSYGR